MTRILTNVGALAALDTLRSISGSMEMTQKQVSSGYRVATATDTRLKAPQTQEQLGIQALQIANASADNVMQLFR